MQIESLISPDVIRVPLRANDRLGAIRDIQLVIEERRVDDDLLIMAGDNIFTFALRDFVGFFEAKRTPVIAAYALHDEEKLKRTGVVQLDANARVIDFEEKPAEPKSNLGAAALRRLPRQPCEPRCAGPLHCVAPPAATGARV